MHGVKINSKAGVMNANNCYNRKNVNWGMVRVLCFLLFFAFALGTRAQIDSFTLRTDVLVCIDKPLHIRPRQQTIVCFFALPNGNTIQQTMGKLLAAGDDWHYDIQHIRAQTEFIRQQLRNKNFILVYLGTKQKSWPAWKKTHADYKAVIPELIDSLTAMVPGRDKQVYLNSHSGGGSLIFGYLDGVAVIPPFIKRISFIDSNYGYDSTYGTKIKAWLLADRTNVLTVFAYNDSVALYNGKPVVSPMGGTWYHSHWMLKDLSGNFAIKMLRDDSLQLYQTAGKQISVILKTNPGQKIFHTQQVELNGFIHSVLLGTRRDSKTYSYFGPRAYTDFIKSVSQRP
jgi:hypothetical protein